MLIRSQTTTLLQFFCELFLYSQVIFKSMKVADDTSKMDSECEWVKEGQGVCMCTFFLDERVLSPQMYQFPQM